MYNPGGMARATATFVAVLLVLGTACTGDRRTAQTPVDMPVDAPQRILALDAVNALRDSFNTASCQSIYDQAAAFFRTQASEQWIGQCNGLQEGLGSWQSFRVQGFQRCGSPEVIVCVGGVAGFSKDEKEMKVALRLDHGHAQLAWLRLRQSQNVWVEIPPRLQHRRFQDPPPRPPLNRGQAEQSYFRTSIGA
jgi:hypothetical protein